MTDKTALILVDIQNDYFTGGLWPVDDMQRVADTARDILNEARAQGQMRCRAVLSPRHCGRGDPSRRCAARW
jgi:hypothetical protein